MYKNNPLEEENTTKQGTRIEKHKKSLRLTEGMKK
jgi:hypothetical protein